MLRRWKNRVCYLAISTALWSLSGMLFAQTELEPSDCLVVIISGFGSDPSPEQIQGRAARGHGNSGMYQLMRDLEAEQYKTQFFNWNGTTAGKFTQKDAPGANGIASYIRRSHEAGQFQRLVIVGHSWGGHTLLEVAQELDRDTNVEVALALCVDPSSLSRGERPKELPTPLNSCVIYFTHNAFVWGPWNDCERVENVDLGDTENGFQQKQRANYASKFDINAHNAAEWDEAIHKDINRRIKEAVLRSETDVPTRVVP